MGRQTVRVTGFQMLRTNRPNLLNFKPLFQEPNSVKLYLKSNNCTKNCEVSTVTVCVYVCVCSIACNKCGFQRLAGFPVRPNKEKKMPLVSFVGSQHRCSTSEKNSLMCAKKIPKQDSDIFCTCQGTTVGQFHQFVYVQLLRPQILKAQKLLDLTVFFALLGSGHVKAASKMLLKLTHCRQSKVQ